MKIIKCWTLQPIKFWEKLQKEGKLICTEEFIVKEFKKSYLWMMQQMKRLDNYNGNYPIWVWVKPKPDLRVNHGFKQGEKGVRLELSIPENRILISDFGAWHGVLNCWYLYLNKKDGRIFEKELKKNSLWFPLCIEHLPENLRQQVINSWSRIFDIDKISKSGWSKGDYL